jgi:hypothetical protein
MVTTLLALALSNVLFFLWEERWIPSFNLSLHMLAYVAQAVGSSIGAFLDYRGHSIVYEDSDSSLHTRLREWKFYALRIALLPAGLGTFMLAYEWHNLSYLTSSSFAAAVGWASGYTFFDKLFRLKAASTKVRSI